MKSKLYWRFFLKAENDFINILSFIEFHPNNFQAHSIEFVRLFLSLGSEVDTILKLICSQKEDLTQYPEMKDYINYMNKHHPRFYDNQVLIPAYQYPIIPWEKWKDNSSPDWWTSYNKLKHNRAKEFKRANLENTLNALAGLYILLLAYYKSEFSANHFSVDNELLDFEGTSKKYVTKWNTAIKGFENG